MEINLQTYVYTTHSSRQIRAPADLWVIRIGQFGAQGHGKVVN